jgi:protein-tyrosine phosphatase
MNCDSVLPELWVGADPREGGDFEMLKARGITAILSLQTEDDLRGRGIGWEARGAVRAGLVFSNVPVTDFDAKDLRLKLAECVKELDRLLKAGHTVYVHCTAGVSRSPTVVVAYLHWCRGWALEEALVHIQDAHICSPSLETVRQVEWPGSEGE